MDKINRMPQISNLLIMQALLFVPGVYLILLISAILSLCVGIILIMIIISISNVMPIAPVGIMIAIMVGIFVGLYAVIKGIAVSIWIKPDYEIALLIKKDEENVVNSLINDLCEKMNTQFPDYIVIHSEPVFYVKQGKICVINGEAKGRILAIG